MGWMFSLFSLVRISILDCDSAIASDELKCFCLRPPLHPWLEPAMSQSTSPCFDNDTTSWQCRELDVGAHKGHDVGSDNGLDVVTEERDDGIWGGEVVDHLAVLDTDRRGRDSGMGGGGGEQREE